MKMAGISGLKRREIYKAELAALPAAILIERRAVLKAFKICELVREIHGSSYEWYGFTLADAGHPEVVTDVGLPGNDRNAHEWTGIGPESIAAFRESLPPGTVINGWIHSHGKLDFREFSKTDRNNHRTVLDYVSTWLKKPVGKREVVIRDLKLLTEGRWSEGDFGGESVDLITDVPVRRARLLETVTGSFCFAIVIGEGGWHVQEIHYKKTGILTGWTVVESREAELVVSGGSEELDASEVCRLAMEVAEKIRPGAPLREGRGRKAGRAPSGFRFPTAACAGRTHE